MGVLPETGEYEYIGNGEYIHKKGEVTVPRCPFALPLEITKERADKLRMNHERRPPEERFPELWAAAQNGAVKTPVVERAYRKHMARRPLVHVTNEDASHYVFRGKQKGCPWYNDNLRANLDHAAKKLTELGGHFYFLTITYAYKIHGKAIPHAWRTFNAHVGKLMQALTRKFQTKYICVYESTSRGYPHAHIIIQSKEALDEIGDQFKPGQEVLAGVLKKFLRPRLQSPVYMLQKALPSSLAGYLCKYVSKGLIPPSSAIPKTDPKSRSSHRKALLSCMLPVIAGTRAIRMSKGFALPHTGRGKSAQAGEEASQAHRTVPPPALPQTFGDLIRLMTKSTLACPGSCKALFNPKLISTYKDVEGYYKDPPPWTNTLAGLTWYNLGCPGCPLRAYAEKTIKERQIPQEDTPVVYTFKAKWDHDGQQYYRGPLTKEELITRKEGVKEIQEERKKRIELYGVKESEIMARHREIGLRLEAEIQKRKNTLEQKG
jgi:hypothetical protein